MANAVGCKAAKTARFHQAEFAEMKAEYRSRNNERSGKRTVFYMQINAKRKH